MIAINAVDLFCGAGGMSLGLQQAGIEVVAAFDAWDKAVDTYNHNIPGNHAQVLDLADIDLATQKVGSALGDGALWQTMVVGGPPCQDFSHSGNRQEGNRAELTVSFAHIISNVRPDIFIMENVPRSLSSNAYTRASTILTDAGYTFVAHIFDASLYGVPQSRKRAFTVGALDSNVATEFSAEVFMTDTSHHTTVSEYFGDSWDLGEHYFYHPRSYKRRAVYSIHEPAPTMRGVNRPQAPGYPGHPADTAPAQCVQALSTRHRLGIQTFPESFEFPHGISVTEQEQMIGNAVPPKMAQYLGSCLSPSW